MASSWETAEEAKVKTLYHYQPFDLARLSRILLGGFIHFSNPKDFNDPWDCHFAYNPEAIHDPDIHENHIKYFDEIGRRKYPDLPEKEHLKRSKQLGADSAKLINMIKDCSKGMQEVVWKQYRVYSMTTKPDCPLMWAHYADSHTGVCLGFNTDNDTFREALKIDYVEEYPEMLLSDDDETSLIAPLLSKSSDWEYEDEFRLIAQESSFGKISGMPITNDGEWELPPGSLTEILIGCRATEDTIKAVKHIADKSPFRPAVYKMKVDPAQYKLNRVPIE